MRAREMTAAGRRCGAGTCGTCPTRRARGRIETRSGPFWGSLVLCREPGATYTIPVDAGVGGNWDATGPPPQAPEGPVLCELPEFSVRRQPAGACSLPPGL